MTDDNSSKRGLVKMAILLFVTIATSYLLEYTSASRAVEVEGIVIKKHTDQNLLGSEQPSRIVVAYTVGGFRRNLVTGRGLAEQLAGNLEPGMRVPVLVEPNDPNKARLATVWHTHGTSMFLSLLGAILIAGRALLGFRHRGGGHPSAADPGARRAA